MVKLSIVLLIALLICSCGASGQVSASKNDDNTVIAGFVFLEPVIDPENLDTAVLLYPYHQGQFCMFLKNVYNNFYPEIDDMDLTRLENENGQFDCSRVPVPYIDFENPDCNNPMQNIACHDEGVIKLFPFIKRLTGCHEFIHYLLYTYSLNPICRGEVSGFDSCDQIEHDFELFEIQRSDNWDLVCEGLEWMFADGVPLT